MIRASLFVFASLTLLTTIPAQARGPKAVQEAPAAKEGFRVYSVGIRCQARRLEGTYDSLFMAFHAANKRRSRFPSQQFEVTTGSEGDKVPAGRPVVYHVYSMACEKAGWEKRESASNSTKANEIAKKYKDRGDRVEVLLDFAPKEVFHIYGGGCRRSWRLLGTYTSLREACSAAEQIRNQQKLDCEVTTGTKGEEFLSGSTPTKYAVYAKGCKGGWYLAGTTTDHKKALQIAEARKKDDGGAEVVHQHASK
jgi:hypothetical protein